MVFGDKEEALRRLGTPVRALHYATPISQVSTPDGQREVRDLLGRWEHGVLRSLLIDCIPADRPVAKIDSQRQVPVRNAT